MERLTERNKKLENSDSFNNLNSFEKFYFNNKIYLKLRDFEDFMEDFDIKNLQDLEKQLFNKEN